MKRLLSLACAILFAFEGAAAPIRQPRGMAEAEQLPELPITRIKTGTGAIFGNWHIWGIDVKPLRGVEEGGPSIVLINQTNGLVLYLPWTSNGWVNHRNSDGKWHVLFNSGQSSPQDRADLRVEQFNGRRPEHRLAAGQHEMAITVANREELRTTWQVKVTADTLEFYLPSGNTRITLYRTGAEFTNNNRIIGGNK